MDDKYVVALLLAVVAAGLLGVFLALKDLTPAGRERAARREREAIDRSRQARK